MVVETRPAPIRSAPGPIRFARYAYGPNSLGYCGPDAAEELFGEATEGGDLRHIRELARGFEGAWPYLELIARANGIADPLDGRVVEAYWLGSELLDRVPVAMMADSLDTRFRARLRPDPWRWLAAKAPAGARPVHAFHVFDVFPRVGLMRGGNVTDVLTTIDSCRIRWGTVLARLDDRLLVDAVSLTMVDGRLVLGAPRPEAIRDWHDGHGFVDDAAPGDVVSIHWDWACERLDDARLGALRSWTVRQLVLANQTI